VTSAELYLHLVSVILFFSGMAVAGAAFGEAWTHRRPREIALILGISRIGVVLVGVGALAILATGFSLLDDTGYGLDDGWVAGALGLLISSVLLGWAGGQKPRQARLLAERLADEADAPSDELDRLLRDRPALVANVLAAAATFAALALMVWKP